MGNGMNRVLPGLFVGNYRDSKDATQLERHKITHIIAIHDAARRIHSDKEYLCIMASDSPYQNLSQYFPICNDFIHSARIQGGNVLIHCLAGMSRSVTIAVAYIMSITSLRWNEALKVVRGARAVSNPNSGFQKQLQEFESSKLPEERRRLLEKFPGTMYQNDEEQCKKLLAHYNNMLLSRVICEGKCTSAKICPTGTCRAHASPRLGRHKSIEGSAGGAGVSRAGSTKSLDSATAGQEPGSPKNWERHYGCWKNHVKHRQGTSSTPSTPILYRAKPQRTDSVSSITSMSSVTSLPAQIANEESNATGGTAGSSMSASMVERNPFLATQSCPNSPRRQPRKMPAPSAAALAIARGGLGSKLNSTSNLNKTSPGSSSNLTKVGSLSKLSSTTSTGKVPTNTTKAASPAKTSTSTSSANKGCTSGATPASAPSRTATTRICGIGGTSKGRPSSASAVLQQPSSSSVASSKAASCYSPLATTTSPKAAGPVSISAAASTVATSSPAASASSTTSSPLSSPWGTPPSSPAHRASSLSMRKAAAAGAASGSKNVTVSASGATRWVMKRSAYRFSVDKNS